MLGMQRVNVIEKIHRNLKRLLISFLLSLKQALGIRYSILALSTGGILRLRNLDILSIELLSASFEPNVQKRILEEIKPGMVVLDIGANIGFYTIQIAYLVGEAGCVVAFEPNPRLVYELQTNIQINGLKNVVVENIALSDQPGEMEFYFPQEGSESHGSLRSNSTFQAQLVEKINTETLDNVLNRLNITHVDFLKIDVEGAERLVFRGADKLLSRSDKPVIIFECAEGLCSSFGHHVFDVLTDLSRYGYEIIEVDLGNWLARPK
jgi:FkbM family methyltransferase